jgi:hypothetical protein
MRTTVTLDADVAAEIERIRVAEGRGFKRVLNDLVRDGVKYRAGDASASAWKSPIHPRDVGEPQFDIANFERAITWAEGEDHK